MEIVELPPRNYLVRFGGTNAIGLLIKFSAACWQRFTDSGSEEALCLHSWLEIKQRHPHSCREEAELKEAGEGVKKASRKGPCGLVLML